MLAERIDAIPAGGIIMWSGSIASIPDDWALCDGNNGTPDLRDKFIVGAKQDDGGVAKTNITGSLTQSGGSTSHDHNAPDGHILTNGLEYMPGSGDVASGDVYSYAFEYDNVTVAIDSKTTVQPYYALAYIMKL